MDEENRMVKLKEEKKKGTYFTEKRGRKGKKKNRKEGTRGGR